MFRTIAVLTCALISATCFGQFRGENKWSIEGLGGLGLGHMESLSTTTGLAGQGTIAYQPVRQFGFMITGESMLLSAEPDERGKAFNTALLTAHFDIHVNVAQLFTGHATWHRFSPFFSFGGGLAASNAYKVFYDGERLSNAVNVAPMASASVGAYVYMNAYFDLVLKYTGGYILNDEVDGISLNVIGNQYDDAYSTFLVGLRLKAWMRRQAHVTGRNNSGWR